MPGAVAIIAPARPAGGEGPHVGDCLDHLAGFPAPWTGGYLTRFLFDDDLPSVIPSATV